MNMKKLDIIVPVYGNPELTSECVGSIIRHWGEIEDANPRIILIDDSPHDLKTSSLLDDLASSQSHVLLLKNQRNLGFVQSTNRGLAMAFESGRDALLVNSDTVTFGGTLAELRSVAYADEMIGFACPRSNNAALSTFPHISGGRVPTPELAFELWRRLGRTLPRFQFVPTSVGFYLYVKSHILGNMGGLREDFGKGYEEENDLVMRGSKAGYRAVMANHSFAFHAGSASFALSGMDLSNQRESNLRKMQEIHPEFLPLVRRYEASPYYRAERALSGLKADSAGRMSIVFDLSAMGCNYNGTNELALGIIRGCAKRLAVDFKIAVLCSAEAFEFHELDGVDRVTRVDASSPGLHAIAVRTGQPFDLHHINVLEGLAPVNIYGMLDTIAEDCGHLSISQRLQPIWNHVAQTANGVFFISDYSRRSFLNRFDSSPDCQQFTRLLPTRRSAYSTPDGGEEDHILVLGNHFPHKASDYVAATIARQFPSLKVEVLGGDDFSRRNLTSYQSGTVSEEKVRALFADASIVVLPSHVEGFGFGMMHAVSAGKTIVARDIPATREILRTFKDSTGIFLFETDAQIKSVIEAAMCVRGSSVDDSSCDGWEEWGEGFLDFCRGLLESNAVFGLAQRRILAGDWLRGGWSSATSVVEQVPRTYFLPRLPLPAVRDDVPNSSSPEPVSLLVDILGNSDDASFLRSLYLHMLKRPADDDGMRFYLNQLAGGFDRLDLVEQFATSKEARNVGISKSVLAELEQVRLSKT